MTILPFLKQSELVRKVFGQRELKIIEKQLLGIALTQSEKNRLSRDIRKKFQFIEKVSRFAEEFGLKKGAETKKKIQLIKEIILQDPLQKKIQKITLFGSIVENTITFRSDIDIAVTFDHITLSEATLFRKRVLGKAPERADIQVYNILPAKIQQEVEFKGKIIYDREKCGYDQGK